MVYFILLLNIACLVTGQTMWKYGLNQMDGSKLPHYWSFFFSPLFLLGLALFGIGTILWIYVLSKLPLSIAYPLQSLAYVLGIIIAYFFLHEHIPLNRWLGAAIIFVGITILSWK